MLKVYSYTKEDLFNAGYRGTAYEPLALKEVEYVKKPEQADLFTVNLPMFLIDEGGKNPSVLYKLPHLKHDPTGKRHVLYDCSDFDPVHEQLPELVTIRCNTKAWHKKTYPNTIPWSWPVENLSAYSKPPDGGFRYDVGFQGWISGNVRHNCVESILRVAKTGMGVLKGEKKVIGNASGTLSFDVSTYPDFFGYIENTHEGKRRRVEFLRSLQECRTQLCPSSIHGVFPYRFFEALSAGRVPFLFCTGYNLPFAHKIPWNEIAVFFDACDDTVLAGQKISSWLRNHTDEQILDMGMKGFSYWDRYLNRDFFAELMTEALEDYLKGYYK